MLTIRDIGVWSHFVADGSQPLHVTVHFNGWGEYPNPNGYSTEKTVHAFFETTFVGAHATAADVSADIRPLRPSNDPIAALVENYLRTTSSYVVPLYQIEKANGFAQATPAAIAFTDARIADGAAEMRDLVSRERIETGERIATRRRRLGGLLDNERFGVLASRQ